MFFKFGSGLEGKECETCKALKEQLEYERKRHQELLEIFSGLIKPVPIVVDSSNPQPLTPRLSTWSRRKIELEREDRARAEMLRAKQSPVIAKPDEPIDKAVMDENIKQLEMELGISVDN